MDLSKNTKLGILYCEANLLTSLDVTNNTRLWHLDCRLNYLPNKAAIAGLDERRTSLLFDPQYEAGDEEAITIPDVNFKRVLIDRGVDKNGDGEISKAEAKAARYLWVNNYEISDLSGIEYFVFLEVLSCANNLLATIDLSKNTELRYLDCRGNYLSSLDVTKNTELYDLDCSSNQLTGTMDLSNLHLLYALYCDHNQLNRLILSPRAFSEYWSYIDVSHNFMTGTYAVTGKAIVWNGDNFIFFPQKPYSCSHPEEEETAKGPTCLEMGAWETRCLICNEVIESGEMPALGHDWDDGVVTTAPTAGSEGIITFSCKREGCDKTREEVIPRIKTVSVGAQSGKLTTGTAGNVTFVVTTANIVSGATIRLNGEPSGVALGTAVTTGDITTVTINATAAVAANTYSLTLTIDGITSAAFALTISSAQIGFTGGGGSDEPPAAAVQEEVEEPELPLTGLISFAAFIEGYPDNTFQGGNVIVREEFINILFKLKFPNPEERPAASVDKPSFGDVAFDRWSYDAIEWAVEAGIVDVEESGIFEPKRELTRAEMAVMLARAEGWVEISDNIFCDIDDHPAYDDILKAVAAGVFNGYEDGTFRPDVTATRYEMVTALIRYLLGEEPEDDMWKDIDVKFADTPRTHWAFKYLALATAGFKAEEVVAKS